MTTTGISAQKHCHQCDKTQDQVGSLKTCSGCRTVYYCSKGCQKAAWEFHKHLCKKVTTMKMYRYEDNSEIPQVSTMRVVPEELQSEYSQKKHINKMTKPVFGPSQKAAPISAPNQIEVSHLLEEFNGEKILHSINYANFRDSLLKEGKINSLIDWFCKAIINWPHPIFYLDFSSVYFNVANNNMCQPLQKDDFFAKSRALREIGMAIVRADVKCIINDPACGNAVSTLEAALPFNQLSSRQQKKHQRFLKEEVHIFLSLLLDKCPSPIWAGLHGQKSYMGIQPVVKPAAECKSAREKELRNLLEKTP